MKIVHYESNSPWVGNMKCPNPKCGRNDSCLIRDRLYSHEVCIGSKPKYWWRLLTNTLTSLGMGRS
ncbi:hypothetical protein CDN93_10830 [Escherichia coli]|uniref:Uncharacterized protein n=1 Tax=Salmonella typhi TaxID=90370 RepID=A0A5U8U6B6_SALTI|nr:hypothetical protein AM408_00555 [Escherichia coli]ATM40744.1 hypothetical protein CRN23_29135 [Klebsiella pneumoniae]EAA0882246.1 hypothetical protein [Shigella sonnei]EAA1455817.1 hypothetical protein [Shigella flexneri]EAA3128574.1 hypothetical protein [Shigella boydii]EAB8873813.1 hypothetical protein [Salmonella enterica subsp. enterica serovar Typhi]EAC2136263.1 hypothetical protein [Salmonella enterica subsp. enterica serovar Senftenberg]EAM7098758.1 hypothetical protein [Salmonell